VAIGLSAAEPLASQADPQPIRDQVAAWWQDASRLAPGNWGIAIANDRGEIIWSVAADEPLVPASTVKLFTTGFARSVLGSDARRATRVVGEGHLDRSSGQWVGTWALELNGDVTLERGAGYGPSLFDLASQMHAQGIRRIAGPFAVRSAEGDANATWPSVWAARHRGRLFAPLIGPVTLHENVVSFTVRPAAKAGQRVRLTSAAPEGVESLLRITATTVAGRRSRLRFTAQPDGSWLISGTLGVRAGARQYGAVANKPKLVLRAVWASALARAGIEWAEKAAPVESAEPPRVLAEVTSPPLDSVASEVNRRSLNIGAELLLQWAAGRGPEASQALTEHVRRVTGTEAPVRLVDGSGLSYEDRVAPSTFVSYLARFPTTPAGRNFPLLLPANGSGTLRRLAAGLPETGVVRAKTGTLNEVSTVVGYLGRPEGMLIVSLMYNGRKTSAARQQQWQLFRVLGADGVVIPAEVEASTELELQLGGDSAPTPGPVSGPAGN
jgi:D-alanyl-D-alanine carboxypeptidase/D-alanyl-D-alanine-endopeptidase (penicillin-binding protein 4)